MGQKGVQRNNIMLKGLGRPSDGPGLVTRVAMGTLNNRRFINMATVPVGTAKTFLKFIKSVIQVCNIAMVKKNSLELETLDLNFNFSRKFLLSGKIRIEKVDARGKVWH